MSELQRAAAAVVDHYLAALEGETRRVADREWGLTVDAAGWPLHVGVAIRDGLLRAQAEVVGAGQIDPHALLRWNRGLPHARFAETGSGDVWVEADLALEAVTPERLDGFLGLFVRVGDAGPRVRRLAVFLSPRAWPERRASKGSRSADASGPTRGHRPT